MSLVIWQARAMPQASLERENDARWWYTCQFRPLNPRQRQAEQRYGVRFDTRPYHPGYDHARYHGQVAEAELVSTRHGLISAHFGNAVFSRSIFQRHPEGPAESPSLHLLDRRSASGFSPLRSPFTINRPSSSTMMPLDSAGQATSI